MSLSSLTLKGWPSKGWISDTFSVVMISDCPSLVMGSLKSLGISSAVSFALGGSSVFLTSAGLSEAAAGALGAVVAFGGSVGFLSSPGLPGTAVAGALGSVAALGGSTGFLPSADLPGAAVVGALVSVAALGFSVGFLSSPGLPGAATGGLGSTVTLGGAADFLPSSAFDGSDALGGVSATGVRNAPINGFFLPSAIGIPPFFRIMSKNASQTETHFQPLSRAEVMLDRCLVVVADGSRCVV